VYAVADSRRHHSPTDTSNRTVSEWFDDRGQPTVLWDDVIIEERDQLSSRRLNAPSHWRNMPRPIHIDPPNRQPVRNHDRLSIFIVRSAHDDDLVGHARLV
jgi:hypothetical protein